MSSDVQGALWGAGLFLALALPSAWLLWRDMTWQKQWVPLQGTGFVYLPSQVHGPQLATAVELAIDALAAHGPWNEQDCRAALKGWRISVHDTSSWYGWARQKVAGQTWAWGVVEVGSDLKALCHEFAHVVSGKRTGDWLSGHEGWATRGLSAAEQAYVAELGGGA